MRSLFLLLIVLSSLNLFGKSIPEKRKKMRFSIEYIHSVDTYNRSIRTIGYFNSNFLWGIYGESTSDHKNAFEENAISKGCLYNVVGVQLGNFLSIGPMVGYGQSLYNTDNFQYGGFLGLRVSKFLVSAQFNTTTNFGLGIGLYIK
ncbi:hypothetical protein K4L44_10870 [Halosquirtibacter laminarini]|uniref:Uncharacterized protein n=1 Tax=Halosquirtibacter laminarini TaxID=3374600 RepID=A0AC61NC46_9BACT|nr:hypothetical protein K4L44_10870 [Prolixibacteraceae bacterium]